MLEGIDPDFSLAGTVLVLALVAWLGLAVPFLSRRSYRRPVANRRADPLALERTYRRGLVRVWLTVGVAIVIVAVSPGVSLDDVGVALPWGWRLWLTMAFTVYTVGALLIGRVKVRRRVLRGDSIPGRDAIASMLPRTRVERRLAFWLAITAGVGEEILYRGLLIAAFVGILGWAPLLAALAALAVFSFGHLYQGRHGIFQVTLIGFVLTALYGVSGSLAPSIIVHVVVDVIAFLFLPIEPMRQPEEEPEIRGELTPTAVEPLPAAQLRPIRRASPATGINTD